MVLVAAGAIWLLLGTHANSDKLDAIRTGGTLGVGLGGIVALWLAIRRQRSTELDVLQKYEAHRLAERAAQDARDDAQERRITELYTKAIEQLGASAPVRLGGLYALERLAQDTESQRQTIVNVICAYLRMPFTPVTRPPMATSGADLSRIRSMDPDPASPENDPSYQEQQVRLAAQRILTDHLRDVPGNDDRHWRNIDLNLSGATLIDLDLALCRVSECVFTDATFVGRTDFMAASIDGWASFSRARFLGDAVFHSARFERNTTLIEAWFASLCTFQSARFEKGANFGKVGSTVEPTSGPRILALRRSHSPYSSSQSGSTRPTSTMASTVHLGTKTFSKERSFR